MEKNQATFGKLKYGLHGQPLPNFFYKSSSDAQLKSSQQAMQEDTRSNDAKQSQKTIEWWKKSDSYQQKPKHISNREFNQKKKYWAKPD